MFGIEAVAFSLCCNAVVKVAKAGGLVGEDMARMGARVLREGLKWLDAWPQALACFPVGCG